MCRIGISTESSSRRWLPFSFRRPVPGVSRDKSIQALLGLTSKLLVQLQFIY